MGLWNSSLWPPGLALADDHLALVLKVTSPTHADAFVGKRNASSAEVIATGVSKFVGGAASTTYNVASGVGQGGYAAGKTLHGGMSSVAASAGAAAGSVASGIGQGGWAAASSVARAASYWSGYGQAEQPAVGEDTPPIRPIGYRDSENTQGHAEHAEEGTSKPPP